ncbi:DUF6228 family protein [Luteimonas aquatica]|uniref:DUF6228 family protein n=1 Tax=Luteimonas aquatica TaxID=450364 RepID=UPI003CE530D2
MVFLSPEEDYFTVELRGEDLQATRRVYAYTDAAGLNRLFARLAEYERPWTAEESWESLEGEFLLSASCSPLGIVTFLAAIYGSPGAPEEWHVSASITTELGQLPSIAAGAKRFFGGA